MPSGACSFKSIDARYYAAHTSSPRTKLFNCQCEWLTPAGVDDIDLHYVSKGGNTFCLLHAEFSGESDAGAHSFDQTDYERLIKLIVERASDHRILDFAGVRFGWHSQPWILNEREAFGVDVGANLYDMLEQGIALDQCVVSQVLEISDIASPETRLSLRRAEFQRGISIRSCSFSSLDLSNATINGDLVIEDTDILDNILLDKTNITGSLIIRRTKPSATATIGRNLSISRSRITGALNLVGIRVGSNEPSSSRFVPAIEIDPTFYDPPTSLGALKLSEIEALSDVRIRTPNIRGVMQLTDVSIYGHFAIESAELSQNVFVRDLAISPASTHVVEDSEQEAIQYRRELHALQKAAQRSGDIVAHTGLVRVARKLERELGRANPMRIVAWSLHEFCSRSGESWVWPISWLGALSFLSLCLHAAAHAAVGQDVPWDELLLLSALCTFLPFSFIELWFAESLPSFSVVWSVIHSMTSVGLILCLAISIRMRQIPAE